MAVKDLDAKRAARGEVRNKPHEVILGGETFQLPPRIPLESIELMGEAKFREAFGILLGDEDATRRFLAHRPDDGDLEEIMGLYGSTTGESSASPTSLLNGGRPPKQTGKRTTAAT